MIDYAGIRKRVGGPTVPLPVFYREDLSVDYEGLERYVNWIVDAGIKCMVLTHGYSQLGFIDEKENLEITRIFAAAARDRAVFFASTREELRDAPRVIEDLYATGADGVFVMPPPVAAQSGPDYVRVLCHLLEQTDTPLLAMSYGKPGEPSTPMIPMEGLDLLVEHENFIGLKDDVNLPRHRLALIDRYGDRLAIIGGGLVRNYMQFCHYPCQGELDGFWSPRRSLRFVDVVAAGRLHEALRMVEEWDRVCAEPRGDVQWQAHNQVVMHALGFAATYRVRPPLVPATEEQARRIFDSMKKHPEVYESAGGS